MIPLLTGIPVVSADVSGAPLFAPDPSSGPSGPSGPSGLSVHVKLHIRSARLNVLDGSAAGVSGSLRPVLAKRAVELQRLGRHGWETIARTLTLRGGRFRLHYVPHRLLSEPLRVYSPGGAGDLSASRGVGRLTSYRLADASWYGGGGMLACGGELTSSTLGVANKTLPCGTLVTLRYDGHSVRVPVVDRGPYVEGREFDLTEATKRALGFEGVGEVWSDR